MDGVVFFKSFSIFFLVITPWLLFSYFYFDGIIPQSVIAKYHLAHLKSMLDDNETLLFFLTKGGGFFSLSGVFPFQIGALFFFVGTVISLILCCKMKNIRLLPLTSSLNYSPLILCIVYAFVFEASMYLGKAPVFAFNWYLFPVLWASIFVSNVGLLACYEWIFPRHRQSIIIGGFFLYCLLFIIKDIRQAFVEKTGHLYELSVRKKVGEWLSHETAPDSTIAMEAIGYQAYYSNRRVVDLAGIVTPQVVDNWRQSHSFAEAFNSTLKKLEPDYLVLRSTEVDNNAGYHGGRLYDTNEQKEYFHSHYSEVRRFNSSPSDDRLNVTVFKRENKK